MASKNGYAALVKQRASGATKRRKLDDYETPDDEVGFLTAHVRLEGPILEPACGSGRMMESLRTRLGKRVKIEGTDIKDGDDFLQRSKRWKGDIVTNPPYRDGLADAFVKHALDLADGRVCMLVQNGFLWGGKRGRGLFNTIRPDRILICSERIYFYIGKGSKRLTSQFYSHAWVCWPDRETRERGGYETTVRFCTREDDDGTDF